MECGNDELRGGRYGKVMRNGQQLRMIGRKEALCLDATQRWLTYDARACVTWSESFRSESEGTASAGLTEATAVISSSLDTQANEGEKRLQFDVVVLRRHE